jgi:outer membrane biosynthesis protein TonB
VIKNTIFVVIFLGLGCVFLLQKQHEKKAALEVKKRQEEAVVKAHAPPSPANSAIKGLPKPTPVLGPAPTSKPKPTPMLPKPTPMLKQTP